jgi:hypothetical protein
LPSLLARQQQQQEKLFAKIYESLNRLKSSFNLIAKCKIVFRFFLAFLLAKSEKKKLQLQESVGEERLLITS